MFVQLTLHTILKKLGDHSKPDDSIVYYRPSFGRQSGPSSAQFGEFDFIIITEEAVYLGESKWNYSSELKGSEINLRSEQIFRHQILTLYINNWLTMENKCWEDMNDCMVKTFREKSIDKQVVNTGRKLQRNIETILNSIDLKAKANKSYKVQNVLLYLYGQNQKLDLEVDIKIPSSLDFKIISINCSPGLKDNFIQLMR